jgi:hypothetical protein
MSTIVTRSGKGSPLTHAEVDANFSNLNTDKYQEGSAIGAATPAAGTFTTLIGGNDVANYGQLTGGATTKAVEFKSLGSDTNVALAIQTKGTGAIDLVAGSRGVNISNGGTVTAITLTATGSGYTSFPTPAISAPTTVGGVQAVIAVAQMVNFGVPAIVSGGTGYTLNDILTVSGGTAPSFPVKINVTAVSGGVITAVSVNQFGAYTVLPTNPVSVTGGTGSGATFTLGWGIQTPLSITNAGSGYVEQPTVTFSGGGGSGAAAFADVGTTSIIRAIGGSLNFVTSAGISTGNPSFQIRNPTGATSNYLSTLAAPTGGAVFTGPTGSDANISTVWFTKNTGIHYFATNSGSNNQLLVTHTASAVNYVQVTGATTASKVVAISAQGSDTDVTLSLSPKGAGTIRFGTYTGTILTPTGYITITDSGGTTRRLLVG